MAENPKVSVVIPLYNKGPYIARALDSVLTQTFEDFEVVVIYRESSDDGAEVVGRYKDPRIRLIYQDGRGVSAARNKGADEAKAELIAFLDADDEWLPKHLETIMRLYMKFPEAGAYATAYAIRNQEGREIRPRYAAIPAAPWEGLLPNYFVSANRGDWPLKTSVFCIRKAIFRSIGMYPVGVSYGEDVDLFGRLAIHGPIAFSWETGALYHEDAGNRLSISEVSYSTAELFVKTGREALSKNEIPKDIIPEVLEHINKLELTRADLNIIMGNQKRALEILSNCHTKIFQKKKLMLTVMSLMPNSLFSIFQRVRGILS